MIKFYCDHCGEEIKDYNERGEFEIHEKSFQFIKHQKQDGIRVQKYIFCGYCARSIKKYFQEAKKDAPAAK